MLSCFNRVQLFVIIWTIVCQVPLSMEFSRQEYWNGFPCPPPGDLPNPGIEPMSPVSSALVGFFTTISTWEAPVYIYTHKYIYIYRIYLPCTHIYIYIYIYIDFLMSLLIIALKRTIPCHTCFCKFWVLVPSLCFDKKLVKYRKTSCLHMKQVGK